MAEQHDEFYQQRLIKLGRLRERGVDPYPPRTSRTHTAVEAVAGFQGRHGDTPGAHDSEPVAVLGRVAAHRTMGKATFIDLRDGSGRIQAYFRADKVGEDAYRGLDDLDLGDFLQVEGPLFRTRTGEVTVEAQSYQLLTKALQPPPEKYHGLSDVETRLRHRYLDLMSNEETRQTFTARSRIVSAVRRYMDDRGFLEMETPILQPQAGGAMARPFVTHYNALDEEYVLRIATELHLKRLLVGGFERVYEIGRIFRNEGVSHKHNPEYTLMESYQAYADYQDVLAMVEDLVSGVAQSVLGTMKVPHGDHTIDLTPPWRRLTLRDAILQESGIDFLAYETGDDLRAAMAEKRIYAPPGAGYGKLVDELLSTCVEPKLIQPTFLTDYPIELSPLAKKNPNDPRLVERFEAFVIGIEIANAYSELNDPLDQRERFSRQAQLRALGDEEAELPDEDFLFALEHGMPPTGGLGLGIDRLVMLLTNQTTIREVILFPHLRRKD